MAGNDAVLVQDVEMPSEGGIRGQEMDEIGEAPVIVTGERDVSPLPVSEVRRFVDYANRHNESVLAGETGLPITREAVIKTVTTERLMRHWGRQDKVEEMSRMDKRLQSRWLLPARRKSLESQRAILESRLDDWEGHTLWDLASGRWWELLDVMTWEGNPAKVIEGTFLALTEKGEQAYGTDDGMFPMWEIMLVIETADLGDCEEVLCDQALARMTEQGLAYDLHD